MKLQVIAALFTLLTVTNAHDMHQNKLRHAHKRQAAPAGAAPAASSSTSSASSTQSSVSTSAPSSSAASTPAAAGTPANLPGPASNAPPLSQITMGMPTPSSSPVPTTYTAGATPPVSGAPALPTPFVFSAAEWPAQDKVPDTTTDQVKEWMKELEGFYIPGLDPTPDGSCVNASAAAKDAEKRGWWTCGGYTRPTDIVACPDKYTWGVSFDDGPSPQTQTLLNYLSMKKILATFFVVGSRVIERPDVLREQYMTGHEISVHTWSHRHLTSLTTEQIVAELGWTRKAIKKVLGVTPTTMRPPFGDIDDRVRAISLAMGLTPIIWTRTPTAGQFDTNDWQVAGGLVSGAQSFATFQSILGNASLLNTGFIVLQHDLFPETVDLAIGYTLQAALNNNPPFTLKPIGQCAKIPTTDLYRESNQNKTFPYTNVTQGGADEINGLAGGTTNSALSLGLAPTFGTLLAVGLSFVGLSTML